MYRITNKNSPQREDTICEMTNNIINNKISEYSLFSQINQDIHFDFHDDCIHDGKCICMWLFVYCICNEQLVKNLSTIKGVKAMSSTPIINDNQCDQTKNDEQQIPSIQKDFDHKEGENDEEEKIQSHGTQSNDIRCGSIYKLTPGKSKGRGGVHKVL